MRELWNWIQLAFAAIGGWMGWILGGLDGLLYALVAFVVIDYITGVMCAVVEKKLCSEVGAQGIFKKVLIFAMVTVSHILDTQILGVAGDGSAIRTAVIFFYLANEGVSIMENTTRLGLPVPEKLKNVLAQLNGKSVPKTDEPSGPDDGEYIRLPHPEPENPKENTDGGNDDENLS